MTRRDLFRSIATAIVAQGVSQQTGSAVAPTPPIEPDMQRLDLLNLQLDWSRPLIEVTEHHLSPTWRIALADVTRIDASLELAPGIGVGGPHDFAVWCSRDLNPRDALRELFLSGQTEEFEVGRLMGEGIRFRASIQSVTERYDQDSGLYTIELKIAGETMRA